jgi:hypothetical protein
MKTRQILGAGLCVSQRSRTPASPLDLSRADESPLEALLSSASVADASPGDLARASSRNPISAVANRSARGDVNAALRPSPRTSTLRRRGQQSGYAFLFVLGLMLVMIAASVTVLQMGATIRRRRIEQETIWRGNQYARAIRLYYHKTGHYPQNLDDLVKGMPDLHFLRQAYKNPTNSSDGSWRFIYVNAAGQIIGSTKYANLQQMALMDANGGQLPTMPGQPGQPGLPVSSLADANSGGANSQPPQNNTPILNDNSTGSTPAGYTPPDSTQNGSTDASGNPAPGGQNGQPANGDNSQNPYNTPNSQSPQNPQNPGLNSSGLNNLGNGQNSLQGLAALGQAGLAVNPATLAAMATLKPTGPVDGPVLGGFLTGVACTRDAPSQKVYHGGKKYINWEFIWNPLEDAAAAMQQQSGSALGGGLGGGVPGQGTASPFSTGPGGNNPMQPNAPQSPTNPFQQPPQQPQQSPPQ